MAIGAAKEEENALDFAWVGGQGLALLGIFGAKKGIVTTEQGAAVFGDQAVVTLVSVVIFILIEQDIAVVGTVSEVINNTNMVYVGSQLLFPSLV